MLDIKFTQVALKMKNLVLIDLSFPRMRFPEFKSAYESRYLYLPCRIEMAMAFAAGLSSFGNLVVIYGGEARALPDSTLNVKVLKEDPQGSWEGLEEGLKTFGPAVLLIPKEL